MIDNRSILFIFLSVFLAGQIAGRPIAMPAAQASEVEPRDDLEAGAPLEAKVLEPFFRALNDLETGRRTRPVVIVFLGDSHSAGGIFSGRLRTLFQERFGAAGRGTMPPGKPFKFYYPDQVTVRQSKGWTVHNSFEEGAGLYGLSGFRLSSSGKAEMTLVCDDEEGFDRFTLDYIGRPGGGTVTVQVVPHLTVGISTEDQKTIARRLTVTTPRPARRRLKLSLSGDGPVDLISWGLERNRPGVVLESHGIVGATAAVTRNWDREIVAWELDQRRPSLIVLEYGGNEGFNDSLNLEEYRQIYRRQCAFFKKAAPEAALLLIGPSDCARLPEYCKRRERHQGQGQCRPLTDRETVLYPFFIKKRDPRLCRWHPPPMLEKIRHIQREVAREGGYFYWNWQMLMKNDCGIQEWVDRNPPLAAADHVHLTNKGYTISANALFRDLMEYYVFFSAGKRSEE